MQSRQRGIQKSYKLRQKTKRRAKVMITNPATITHKKRPETVSTTLILKNQT